MGLEQEMSSQARNGATVTERCLPATKSAGDGGRSLSHRMPKEFLVQGVSDTRH